MERGEGGTAAAATTTVAPLGGALWPSASAHTFLPESSDGGRRSFVAYFLE